MERAADEAWASLRGRRVGKSKRKFDNSAGECEREVEMSKIKA